LLRHLQRRSHCRKGTILASAVRRVSWGRPFGGGPGPGWRRAVASRSAFRLLRCPLGHRA